MGMCALETSSSFCAAQSPLKTTSYPRPTLLCRIPAPPTCRSGHPSPFQSAVECTRPSCTVHSFCGSKALETWISPTPSESIRLKRSRTSSRWLLRIRVCMLVRA